MSLIASSFNGLVVRITTQTGSKVLAMIVLASLVACTAKLEGTMGAKAPAFLIPIG